jgi:hypothetical protein
MSTRFRPEQFEPRRVRLTRAGRTRVRTLFTLLGLLAAVQAWAIIGAWRHGILRPMMFVAPAFILFGFLLIRNLLSNERELLLTGKLATGRVIENASSPKGAMITFEYQDAGGHRHSRTARDMSGTLRPEDSVPVFYDGERPARCVITPGSFYELE